MSEQRKYHVTQYCANLRIDPRASEKFNSLFRARPLELKGPRNTSTSPWIEVANGFHFETKRFRRPQMPENLFA